MLAIPSLIGWVTGSLPGANPRPNKRPMPRHPGGAPAHRSITLPLGWAKRRAKTVRPTGRYGLGPVECCCFRYCDYVYQCMTAEERDLWRRAIKRPRISAYDLWMSEALTLTIQHRRPPDYPSISGGWSTRHVVEGTTLDYAPCWPTMHHPPPATQCGAHHVDGQPPNVYRQWVTWAANVAEYPLADRAIAYWSWRDPPAAWHFQGRVTWPATQRISTQWAVDHPHPIQCSWPPDAPPRATMPLWPLSPWSILDPNRLPWEPPPVPSEPWPNPYS